MQTFDEAALICTYGDSGAGKTTDCLYSFPNALFIAQPGALKPWANLIGLPYKPAVAPNVRTVFDATDLIVNKAKDYAAIVCDDWSLMCDMTFSLIEQRNPKGGERMWGDFRACLLAFRQAGRDANRHIIMNAHLRPAHVHARKGYVRGGPALPGTMSEDFPKACDMVLRVTPGEYPVWPFLYSANPTSTDYVEKDRHDFVPPGTRIAPMNLGELMRLGFGTEGKFGIRRPQGLEWIEKVVEQIAVRLGATAPGSDESKAILKAFEPLVRQKYTQDPRHINWVFRDAVARACLRTVHASASSPFTS
jgi:hypothetical protein